MSALLTVTDLRLHFPGSGRGRPDRESLRGISFEVAPGEALGIVGESGSGKTLTVRSLLRLEPAGARTAGAIVFDGVDLLTADAATVRRIRGSAIGMVFQDPHAAVNPVHRIGDFMTEAFPAGRRAAHERALTLLSEVGIRDPQRVMQSFPHELSGGMLQRVMIASVLITHPRLILADEPTTALDVTTQADVLALLDEERRAGHAALILISHDLELVAATCDRILVMYQGRIVESLTPAQLRAGDLAEPYTRALLECRPSITERRHRLPVIDPSGWGDRYR